MTSRFQILDSIEKKESIPGHFGLNTGYLTQFEYTDKPFKEGEEKNPRIAITLESKQGKQYFTTIYETTKVFGKVGKNFQEITPQHKDFIKNRAEQDKRMLFTIQSFLQIAQDLETLKKAFENTPDSFKDYAEKSAKIMRKVIEEKIQIDFFVQWQNTIKKGQDQTWLEIPKDTFQGEIVSKHIPPSGEWKPIINSETGLKYEDIEGNIHPFKRSKWFVESNYFKKQKSDKAEKSPMNNMSQTDTNTNTEEEEAPF